MDKKPFDDPEYRDGYIADAEELLERSGLAARLATAEADPEARAKDEARVKALVKALDVARDGLEWAEAHLRDHGTISATVSYATQKTRAALAALRKEMGDA